MTASLPQLTWVYINSASTTAFTAANLTADVVDTAAAAVTVTLPTGVAAGGFVVVKNWPAGGPQFGGSGGSNVTIQAGAGDAMDQGTVPLNPPTSAATAATSTMVPPGAAGGGFGSPGWVLT